MMRYQIIAETADHVTVSQSEASNRTVADAEFTRLVKEQPQWSGNSVKLYDSSKNEVLRSFFSQTREQHAASVKRELDRFFDNALDNVRTTLANLADKLNKVADDVTMDPTYDLAYDETFRIAADGFVARALKAHRDAGHTAQQLLDEAKENVMRGAKWPSQSTSVTTNLKEQCRLAAWANAVEKLEWIVRHEAESTEA